MLNKFRNLLSIDIKKDNKTNNIPSDKAVDTQRAELTQIDRYNNLMKKVFVFNLKKIALLQIIDSNKHDEKTIETSIKQFNLLADEINNDIEIFIKCAEGRDKHFS